LAIKPNTIPLSQNNTPEIEGFIDESGFMISNEFWLKNQLLGDHIDSDHRSIGHIAQAKDALKSENTFEKIKAMDARYYSATPPIHPNLPKYKNKNKNKNKNASYLGPKVENLPVLILKPATDPTKPNGNIYSGKLFTQLKLPCKLCGKPVNTLEWYEHVNKVHPGINIKSEYWRFENQYIYCSGCQHVFQFKDTHKHYINEHFLMTVVTMKIPGAVKNNTTVTK
jgi:hypothetical protein